LDLFSFQDEGPGFPFWHPAGATLFQSMVGYIRGENRRRGYKEVITPIILNESLWHKSGHWDNFRENMYFTNIDGHDYAVKPMNCPGGLLIYKDGLHSYRELPIRNAELGLVHRHELSGVLHGLFRVRSFTQDDAHIFCTPEMIRDEVHGVIDYTLAVYRDFGFDDVSVFIATRPEKSIGSDEDWDLATDALEDALAKAGIAYRIKEGEGAFYGPKIEFNIKDCLGRNWQCGTCQVDFSMPTRFGAVYRGSDGKDHHPVMLHRAIFGSLERFIGIVIEHFAGKFPFWLAPVQAIVLSISEAAVAYAREVSQQLFAEGFRVEHDLSGESLGNKIRVARTRRIPYIVVIGENEARDRTVSVKTYLDENASGLSLEALLELWNRAERERTRGTLLPDIQRG
jgi:threonyl-tRNA synthetase